MPLTRKDLIHPKGQKFAIGDLVEVVYLPENMSHFGFQSGRRARVVGSYAQVYSCGEREDHHIYKLVSLKDVHTSAWYPEKTLKLVPEGS